MQSFGRPVLERVLSIDRRLLAICAFRFNELVQAMIEFDRDEHRYSVNGYEYAGVTATMTAAGLWFFPADESAMGRGRRVHRATELHDQRRLDESTVDESEIGYLEAWKLFLLETKFRPDMNYVEFVVQNDVLKFAGRCDRRGNLPGENKPVYVDLKTGDIHPATAVQLSAYAACDKGIGIRMAVGLSSNGTYRCKIFPMAEFFTDLQTFQAALTVARWKKRMGIR